MESNEVTEQNRRKHIREPPSVPFLWEVKPGLPKKDWRLPEKMICANLAPSTPIKLVASIPFKWEEKPGKPLRTLLQPITDPPSLLLPPANLISFSSPSVQSHDYSDNKDDEFDSDGVEDDADGSNSDDDDDEKDEMFDIDLESFGFETGESFSSAPSLLANRLVSTTAISSAVPVQVTSMAEYNGDQPETPSSPTSEMGSSTSSYATGTTSLVGASFLECLFPLLPPKSGFLGNVGHSEKGSFTPLEQQNKNWDCGSTSNVVIRRPPTLGELIMMSRRRSLRRKAALMRKRNLSMVNLQLFT